MEMLVVPMTAVMNEEQLAQHLNQGWVFLGTLLINKGQQIAVPGQEQPGPAPCNVWLRPEPMLPQQALIVAMMAIAREGADVDTLDKLAQTLFGMTLTELQAAMLPQDKIN